MKLDSAYRVSEIINEIDEAVEIEKLMFNSAGFEIHFAEFGGNSCSCNKKRAVTNKELRDALRLAVKKFIDDKKKIIEEIN